MINFTKPLPFDLDKYMPKDRETPSQKFIWREKFYTDLEEKGLLIFNAERELIGVEDIPFAPEQGIENNKEYNASTKNTKTEQSNKAKKKSDNKSDEKTDEYECIRYMPTEAMNALRELFPYSLSKTELILTVVYIITNGGIEVSEKVKKAAKSYKDDKLTSIEERLSRMERANNRALDRMYAIELASAYILYDRMYGARGPRREPSNENFRTMGTLEMLERIREQAEEQRDDEMKWLNGK